MPWPTPAAAALVPALLAALTVAVLTTTAAPGVLRALPEPEDPEGKVPYAALATRGFLGSVAVGSLACSLIAFASVPASSWTAWTALCGAGVLAAAIDARTTWLPLPLAHAGWQLAASGAVIVALSAASWTPLLAAALGAGAVGGFFHVVWRVSGAFGYGDVRLGATLGAVTALDSWQLALGSLLAGTLAGALSGILHRLRGRRDAFPYGPGLLAGPFLALLWRALAG